MYQRSKFMKRQENNIEESRELRHILPAENKSFSLNCIETQLANNVMIFGGTGSKKTRANIRPNIEELIGNYVILDPKGALLREYKKFFEDNGYKVYVYDFTNTKKSNGYNPYAFIEDNEDIVAIDHMIIRSDKVNKVTREDPFWDESDQILMDAATSILLEDDDIPVEEKNIKKLTEILLAMNEAYNKGAFKPDNWENSYFNKKLCAIDAKHGGRETWGHRQFRKLRSVPEKTMNTVFITAHAKMSLLDTDGLNAITAVNDLDIRDLAEGKTAIFVCTSDIDRSKDLITNIFFTQLMRALCHYADNNCKDGSLPRMVRFFLDDFGTSVRIDQFEHMISNIRARNISVVAASQSIGQIISAYGDDSETILANCDTKIYMGGNDVKTAEYFAHLCNLPTPVILNLPLNHNIIVRRGEEYSINETQDLLDYREKYHPDQYSDVVWDLDSRADI